MNLFIVKSEYKVNKKTQILLAITAILGFLTQYFFAIYAALVAIVMIVLFIKNKRGLTDREMDNRLNKESGILGVFGKSSDCRDMENAVAEGDARAKLAEDMFIYRIKSCVGAYAAVMGGVDAICFAGGIGENASGIRERVIESLGFIGAKIDKEVNSVRKKGNVKLSTDDSRVLVYKIPTNEELVIARDTYRIVTGK